MRYLKQPQLFWVHDTGQINVFLHLVHLGSHSAFTPEQPPKVTLWGPAEPSVSHCALLTGSALFQLPARYVPPMTFEVAATHGDEDRGR